ncbi:MAG: hypothetical protein WCA81_06170 [Rhizomicrobium sp.]
MRAQLLAAGDPCAVRAALEAIIAGPPKATARDFATQLGRMAVHFWTPDFTPEQAKVKYGDFVRLLDGVTAQELADACDAWLLDPRNRFYPTPGQLLMLIQDSLSDRARAGFGAERLLAILDVREAPQVGQVPRDYSALKQSLAKAPVEDWPLPPPREETTETLAELRDVLQRRIRETSS